jgi:hypothetical protein
MVTLENFINKKEIGVKRNQNNANADGLKNIFKNVEFVSAH